MSETQTITATWADVLLWLADNYDEHVAEIEVHSQGRDYDDNENIVGLGIVYRLTLTETGMYGGNLFDDGCEPSYTYYTHVGWGDTLDMAAARAMAMMTEHNAS